MGTHNICLYKEVDKKYTGCILKTTELFDCALIRVCAVIRSNTVYVNNGSKSDYRCVTHRKSKKKQNKKKKKKKKNNGHNIPRSKSFQKVYIL